MRKLLSRCELTHGRTGTRQLDRHEWWLPDLAPTHSNASGQADHLGDTRLGSLAAGPATRSVGRLGRWAGTTPTVEAHGRLAFEQVCRTNVVMKKVISFEILIPYIHSTWIGDRAGDKGGL